LIDSSGSKKLNVGRLDVVEEHISKVPEFVWVLVILCGPKVGESGGLYLPVEHRPDGSYIVSGICKVWFRHRQKEQPKNHVQAVPKTSQSTYR